MLNVPSRCVMVALAEGDTATAGSAIRNAVTRGLELGLLNEGLIDDIGYHFLERGDTDLAIEVFTLNAELHPESHNVYHSLAEACVEKGERLSAIANLNQARPWPEAE